MKDKSKGLVFSVGSAKKDISFAKRNCSLVFEAWAIISGILGTLLLFSPYIGFTKFFEDPFSIGVFVLTRCLSIIGLLFLLRGGALGACEGYIMKSKGKKPRKKTLRRAMLSIAIGLLLLMASIFLASIEVNPSSLLGPSQIAELVAM